MIYPDKLKFTIKKDVFMNTRYVSPYTCAIATCVKRDFGFKNVLMGFRTLDVMEDGNSKPVALYSIPVDIANEIQANYKNPKAMEIEMIKVIKP